MDYKVGFGLLLLIALASCVPYREEKASCACGRIYLPVCSSNGRTYNNMCEFECQAEFMKLRYDEDIFVERHERCEDGS